jgi:hypothetical protein
MIRPDQLYELGRLYHEEAMQKARVRHLEHLAKAHRRPRSEEQGLWSFSFWLGKLVIAVVGSS